MNYALVEVVGNIKNAAYNSFFIKKSILIKISLWLLNIQVFVQIFTQFLCAKVEQIISLEINVSEKIDNENLKDFVLTSLSINNKIFSNKDLIYKNK